MSVVRYAGPDPHPPSGRLYHSAQSRNTTNGNVGHGWSFAHDDLNAYPQVINYPYPKAGGQNPIVSVWIAEVTTATSRNHRRVTPPKELHRT